ncbi:MAG: Hsp20/alpha crystallin family protein [Parafilimonas sp.]
MKNDIYTDYSVYPGQFVSENNEAAIIEQTMNTPDDNPNLPYVNIKELIDEYKIEIGVPVGIEKEKLIVFAENNLLLICSADEGKLMKKGKTFQRHIQLPDDADAELAIAEYKRNILHCYIPKAKQAYGTGKTRIVVY